MAGDDALPTPPLGEIVLYTTEDGRSRVECRFLDRTLWLTQALLAELFQKDVRTINEHLQNIFEEGELDPGATIRKFRIVRSEGGRTVGRVVEHYSLEAILAVGYRVRSPRGTQFRRWATEKLSEFLAKGFVLDDERLKNPPIAGEPAPDHFDELLERIRDIRASERRMYLRVREIFALAADYEPKSEATLRFFKTMQNKLHFATSGKTAAEIIQSRADRTKPNMGLTNWKAGSAGVVRKADVGTAKNYLSADEISELNRIVGMWLDFAEDQAKRRKEVFLTDWEQKLDAFLAFNDRRVLPDAGSVSHEDAVAHAEAEYAEFEARRRALAESEGERRLLEPLEDLEKRPVAKDRKKPRADGSPTKARNPRKKRGEA